MRKHLRTLAGCLVSNEGRLPNRKRGWVMQGNGLFLVFDVHSLLGSQDSQDRTIQMWRACSKDSGRSLNNRLMARVRN